MSDTYYRYVLQDKHSKEYYTPSKDFKAEFESAKIFNNQGTPKGIISNNRWMEPCDYVIKVVEIRTTEGEIQL